MKLLRYENNPILEPNERNWWESKAVFNPGAVYEAGRVHLLTRAIGEYEKYVSRLGHYVSTDGLNFERAIDEPVFAPHEEYEKWGCARQTGFVKEMKLMHTILRTKDGKKEILIPSGTIIGATIVKNLDVHTLEGDTSK